MMFQKLVYSGRGLIPSPRFQLPCRQCRTSLGDAADGSENAVVTRTREITHASDLAAILANRIVQFNAGPDAGSELNRTTVAQVTVPQAADTYAVTQVKSHGLREREREKWEESRTIYVRRWARVGSHFTSRKQLINHQHSQSATKTETLNTYNEPFLLQVLSGVPKFTNFSTCVKFCLSNSLLY